MLGGLHPETGPHKTIFLIGPDKHRFWQVFQNSPEYLDGNINPIDRWSTRVIGDLAQKFAADPIFPFGGPPYHPFIGWALASGQCFQSPVQILVHSNAGLFVSYRGALGFTERLDLPASTQSPCHTCVKKPCLAACPPAALIKGNYDVAACHVFLDTDNGAPCLTRGCAVRRACPVGQSDRPEAQSAFHMSYFHRKAPE